MKEFELSGLDIDELRTLKKDIEKMIDVRLVENRKKARKAVELAALNHGFTLAELGLGASKRDTTSHKYIHPLDPTKKWSGRGRRPYWFKKAMDDGFSPDDLTS